MTTSRETDQPPRDGALHIQEADSPRVELLTVEERFQLAGMGLALLPGYPVPDGWRNRREPATIVTPDGGRVEVEAQFSVAHFNLRDPTAPPERRWQIVICLPATTKEQVPIGSKLWVPPEARDALLSGRAPLPAELSTGARSRRGV